MSKFYFIPFLFFFYLALLPNTIWACGNNSAKQSCCSEDIQSCAEENDDCCQNADANSSETEDEDCGGNCDNNSCHCTATGISLFFTVTIEDLKMVGNFPNKEQQKNSDYNNYLSSGFISIWLPPKIG